MIESPRKSRSTFPCFARRTNESCSFIQAPSRAAGVVVLSSGLVWAESDGAAAARRINGKSLGAQVPTVGFRMTHLVGWLDQVPCWPAIASATVNRVVSEDDVTMDG